MNTEEQLYVVAAFEFEDEAHVARGHLEAQGIESFIVGSDNTGFGGLTAEATYQLVVKEPVHEQAKKIMEEAESNEDDVSITAWTCECGEQVDEGFAICWSCGANWPGGTDDVGHPAADT